MGIILVIEDDPEMAKALQRMFEREGYEVRCACNGEEGLEMFIGSPPDAVILDLMLPGMSGSDVCRSMKQTESRIPVITVSIISNVAEMVHVLELGADDYITKPLNLRELLARVQAAIRRSKREHPNAKGNAERPTGPTFEGCPNRRAFGNIQVNFRSMRAFKNGQPVTLSAHQFKLLRFLLDNPERVLTRNELLKKVWGHSLNNSTRTVDNQILQLRQKLEENPAEPVHFCTVHGTGYRFAPRPSVNGGGMARNSAAQYKRSRRYGQSSGPIGSRG
jgi:DNA-binding response OmpR family regulator